MFYCENCRIENEWPKSLSGSIGNCEVCKEHVVCYDLPSSRLFKAKADAEENDLKAMGMYNKSLREKRLERFEDYLLPLERQGYEIVENNHKYTIDTDAQSVMYGIVDYFPKANKLLIRKENKWIKPGLKWIMDNLLSEIHD